MATPTEISLKDAYFSFVSRMTNVDKINADVLETMASNKSTEKVNTAKTCLCIGPCTGLAEIEFIQRFVPNLQTLTAVESDSAAVEKLKQNLQSHLPNVKSEVHQKTCREFLESNDCIGKSYDVVLFFNILYYVTDEERLLIFKALHDENLLSIDGSIVIEQAINSEQSDHSGAMMRNRLENELRPTRPKVLMDTIKREVLAAGFRIYYEYDYLVDHDFSNPDEALVAFFSRCLVFRPLSLAEFQLALEKVQPSGKFQCNYGIIWLEKH